MKTQAAKSLTELEQMLNQNPNDAWALAHRGEVYCLAGDYRKALVDLDRALALKPNYGWAFGQRGEAYRLLGSYASALADFDRAVTLQPDSLWTLAHRGALYRLMRCYDKAIADLNAVIERKPDYAWALIYRAETHTLVRHYEKALADVDLAFAVNAALTPHRDGERAMLLNFLGRYADAITACQQALATKPDDYIARYSLLVAKVCSAGAAGHQQELTDAEALLNSVLQTTTNRKIQAGVLYRLGGLAAMQQKTAQALQYLGQAIALDDEPKEQVCHDPAWDKLRTQPHFQLFMAKASSETNQ